MAKNNFVERDQCLAEATTPKMVFYHKLDANVLKQFFQEKQYFLRKLQTTVWGGAFEYS